MNTLNFSFANSLIWSEPPLGIFIDWEVTKSNTDVSLPAASAVVPRNRVSINDARNAPISFLLSFFILNPLVNI